MKATVSVQLGRDHVLWVRVEDDTGCYCAWSTPNATAADYARVSRKLLQAGQALVLSRGKATA